MNWLLPPAMTLIDNCLIFRKCLIVFEDAEQDASSWRDDETLGQFRDRLGL